MAGRSKKVVIIRSHPPNHRRDHRNSLQTNKHVHPPLIAATKASDLFRPTNAHPAAPPGPSDASSKSTNPRYHKMKIPDLTLKHAEQTRKMKREERLQEEAQMRGKTAHSKYHYLQKKTHFDLEQVKSLIDMFKALTASSPMDRQKFRQLLHTTFGLNSSAMLDRIFCVFDGDSEGTTPTNKDKAASTNVLGLRGSLDEKIHFSYEIYDVNGDNSIGRDELQNCLRGCFRPVAAVPNEDEDDFEEFEKDIVELAMKKFDVDRDGVIQIGDFHQAVYQDPLLLQALGQCIPSLKTTKAFLAILDTNYDNAINGLSVPGDVGWDICRADRSRHKSGLPSHRNTHSGHLRPKNVVSVFNHSHKKRNSLNTPDEFGLI